MPFTDGLLFINSDGLSGLSHLAYHPPTLANFFQIFFSCIMRLSIRSYSVARNCNSSLELVYLISASIKFLSAISICKMVTINSLHVVLTLLPDGASYANEHVKYYSEQGVYMTLWA